MAAPVYRMVQFPLGNIDADFGRPHLLDLAHERFGGVRDVSDEPLIRHAEAFAGTVSGRRVVRMRRQKDDLVSCEPQRMQPGQKAVLQFRSDCQKVETEHQAAMA